MPFPKINLHIHSVYSDGKDTIEQIMKRALKLGLKYVAITDHFTDSWKEWVSILKNHEKMLEYLEELTDCQEFLRINNETLTLYKGLEIDLGSSVKFIRRYVNVNEFDLILFEYLQDIESIAFIKNLINYWRNTLLSGNELPIFGLAHFNPFHFLHSNMDVLISFLKDYNIYFEFNPSYPDYYSTQNRYFFEQLKNHHIPVAIGCDSHSLHNLNNTNEPLEMISYYNLENNFQILLKSLISLK